MNVAALSERIRDRITVEWLTPSQLAVWNSLLRFDGPPHRVVNVFGPEGVGKTFVGWLLEREQRATYGNWYKRPNPVHPRLVLDHARTERSEVRSIRPLVDQLNIQQIILLSRRRVDEAAMPAFELQITQEDIEVFGANLYRHLGITLEDSSFLNFHVALASLV